MAEMERPTLTVAGRVERIRAALRGRRARMEQQRDEGDAGTASPGRESYGDRGGFADSVVDTGDPTIFEDDFIPSFQDEGFQDTGAFHDTSFQDEPLFDDLGFEDDPGFQDTGFEDVGFQDVGFQDDPGFDDVGFADDPGFHDVGFGDVGFSDEPHVTLPPPG
jgi:hypothetical protein